METKPDLDTYYGQANGSAEVKTVQERCREYYGISDFVVVMNIDELPFMYQVMRPENQQFDQPDSVSMVITNTKPPERIVLQPGETRLVPSYEADLMIKSLMDKMVYRGRQSAIDAAKSAGEENPVLRESVMDPATQHRYIKAIYQGKRDFMQEFNQQMAAGNTVASEIASELEPSTPALAKDPTSNSVEDILKALSPEQLAVLAAALTPPKVETGTPVLDQAEEEEKSTEEELPAAIKEGIEKHEQATAGTKPRARTKA